jgi:hypothetical protein
MYAFTWQSLTLEEATSLSSQRVTRALEQAIELRVAPGALGLLRGAEDPVDPLLPNDRTQSEPPPSSPKRYGFNSSTG